jgi:CheY-like chemotaxis protein
MSTSPIRILVLDDDDIVLRSMVAFLQLEGHEVHGARDTLEASQAIESNALDLLIADIYLPEGTTFSFIEGVRSSHPQLDVVFVSGTGRMADVERARACNAEYITKPLCDADIRRVIDETRKRCERRSTDASSHPGS